MKKILKLAMVLGLLVSGCTKKYCFIRPGLLEVNQVTVGSIMIEKQECFGKITVNRCVTPLELSYLGKTQTGNHIRVGSRVGSRTKVVTEVTYPENSQFIEFQDVKFELVEANDSWIRFKLISISTIGCDKVNGQEVKGGDPNEILDG